MKKRTLFISKQRKSKRMKRKLKLIRILEYQIMNRIIKGNSRIIVWKKCRMIVLCKLNKLHPRTLSNLKRIIKNT